MSYSAGDLWSSYWNPPTSICFFRGQVIAAGSRYATDSPSHTRRVQWSEIGAVRFLDKDEAITLPADPNKNTAGELYLPTEDREIVQRVFPLHDVVIVYGTFTTYKMTPVEKPAPTFGVKELFHEGINNPLAVGGDLHKHLVVDKTGCLHLITATQGGAEDKSLGYEEFLYPLVQGADIANKRNLVSVVYNSEMDEFYISNGRTGYIFNDNGLTETCKHITSMFSYKDAQISDGDITFPLTF